MTRQTLAATTVLVLTTASPAIAWTHLGGDATHAGHGSGAPARLDHVLWQAQPVDVPPRVEEFAWRCGLVATDDAVFVAARWYEPDDEGWLEHTGNALVCYAATDGTRRWAAPLPPDTLDSWSTPCVDEPRGRVLVAAGNTLHALRISDGAPLWQTVLPRSIVNASPTVTTDLTNGGVPANRVFLTDYTGFGTGGQLYAINVDPFDAAHNPFALGEIAWSAAVDGTSGNTVAYADGRVFVASSRGGHIRAFDALSGGVAWATDTGITQLSTYAGFFGGVSVRGDAVYAAAYNFVGTGNNSRLYRLDAATGAIRWHAPCERTSSTPVLGDDGLIYVSAGTRDYGATVKVQAFADLDVTAALVWDTARNGGPTVGGWTHQPLLSDGRLYVGAPDETVFFAPYTALHVLDVAAAPGADDFVVGTHSGSGGTPALAAGRLFSVGADGLFAFGSALTPGDVNCDGAVDTADIDAFVLALVDSAGYAAAFPACNRLNADLNGDGAVDTADIDGFVAAIVGG